MRLLTTLASLCILPALASRPVGGGHGSTTPLSLQMAESIMSRQQGVYSSAGDPSGALQAGFVQKTFSRIAAQYPQHASTPGIASYVARSADSLLGIFNSSSSALRFPMDRLSSGNAMIRLYETTGESKYKAAADVLDSSIAENRRNAEAGLWYYVYPNWSYLDGLFSFGPFWALYTLTYSPRSSSAWSELRRQFALVAAHCSTDGEDGLLVHGYDDSRTAVWANNTLGQSPHVWGRSLGWYVMALVDTVEVLDADSQASTEAVRDVRSWLVDELRHRMRAVAQAVDPASAGWWQVLDQPGREGNYIESSGSSMFVYALLKGVRLGYLEPRSPGLNASYVDVGRRAYAYLEKRFVVDNGNGTLGWNGTVSVCSLNSTASYAYYVGRPLLYNSVLGSAAFVAASLEVERLHGR
ncbi:Unsaturated rhamnogalacturonyl hydrolase [Ascochyta rabiei]|uniref:Unsaturated rhamnogalacturonyl hydrolase n=1 Tax=Didymella rabiei TaxID=5454 RepID=UPI002202638D|nr:Unsaturated rhamnogalacturonyl hydrolase [Ascochyta rabiei]UPX16355.1 Unsaturated rhamnogalacturonyl hydrolase [Ascochyta rabiei]